MNVYIRCLQAERIKHNKNWPWVVAILGPFCQTGFLTLIFAFSENVVRRYKPGYDFWIELNFIAWNILIMPVVAALIFELAWITETESKAWRHLLLLPIRRYLHYLVKCVAGGGLLVISWLLLNFFILAGGTVLGGILPKHIWGDLSWSLLFQFSLYSLLSALPIIGFHAWLSTRSRGLALTLSIVLIGAWVCGKYSAMYAATIALPWGAASRMFYFFDRWNRVIPWDALVWSSLIAGLWIVMGVIDFSRRNNDLL